MEKVIYVLEDMGVGGGCRVVLEHCNRLVARGYEVIVATITQNNCRSWFSLDPRVKHHITGSYPVLEAWLRRIDGYKIATWWKTASVVARTGGEFYLVQDIETSYYQSESEKNLVLDTYKLPLLKITEAKWVTDRLENPYYIGIGIDHDIFKLSGIERKGSVLYNYRDLRPKGPELFTEAAARISAPIETFGFSRSPLPRVLHHGVISDEKLSKLYNSSAILVSTSIHEGFCLPIVEAMACGTAVVTTDSDANMEFCKDGVNCLVVDRSPDRLSNAVNRLLSDSVLRKRLVSEGLKTAEKYQWNRAIDNLERIFKAEGEYGKIGRSAQTTNRIVRTAF